MLDQETRNDDKTDLYSPGKSLNAGEQAALDQAESHLNNDTSPEAVAAREASQEHSAARSGSWETDVSSSKASAQSAAKGLSVLLRKRFGVLGLISILGVGGGLLAAFFGPVSMLANIAQNASINNDSTSTAMERRFRKVFKAATSNDSAKLCAQSKVKCKLGKMGKSFLRSVAKKGITPLDSKGNPMDLKGRGHVVENPQKYKVKVDGQDKVIDAKEMDGFLGKKENRAIASKFYGRRGVMNMAVRSMAGKYFVNDQKFFGKFGMSRDGGIANKDFAKLKASERLEKLKARQAKVGDKVDSIKGKVSDKIKKGLGKADKVNKEYLIAYFSCMMTQTAPKIILAAVISVQLVQLLDLVNSSVLSPASSSQTTGIDDEISYTPDDSAEVGALLTQTAARESDGKMTSALDSLYLLSAIGVINKTGPRTKLPLSNFTPGHDVIKSPLYTASNVIGEASEGLCNTIMNPLVTTSASVLDMALLAMPGPGWIIKIVKVAVAAVVAELISRAGPYLVGELAGPIIELIAKNPAIDSAKAEALGDALGIGLLAFFSSKSAIRHMPGLSVRGVKSWSRIKAEQENFQKEMDIASLSPFDISSRHTFLGSIVNNLQMSMLASGSYNTTFSSVFSNIIKLPSMALSFASPVANAQELNYSSETCGYAKDIGLDTGDPDTTPAMNVAGMQCHGLTREQDATESEEAYDLMLANGYLREVDDDGNAIDIEGATIHDLVTLGAIPEILTEVEYKTVTITDSEGNSMDDEQDVKSGERNPLYDFIDECGSPETGDLIFTAPGCITSSKESYVADQSGGSPSISALAAIPVFLLDYQISSMMSDDDDEEAATNDSTGVDGDGSSAEDGSTSGGAIDAASKDGWIWPMQKNIRSGPCYGRPGKAGVHAGLDINSSYSQSVYAAHDGEVVWAKWYRAGGNAVRIKTPEGIYYTYQHLSSYSVKAGQQVKAGQVVGVGGLTGNVSVNPATKVHLHIVASRSNDDPSYGSLKNSFDPLTLLPKPAPNNYTCTK